MVEENIDFEDDREDESDFTRRIHRAPPEIIQKTVDLFYEPCLGVVHKFRRNFYKVIKIEKASRTMEIIPGHRIELPNAARLITYKLLTQKEREEYKADASIHGNPPQPSFVPVNTAVVIKKKRSYRPLG